MKLLRLEIINSTWYFIYA